MASSHTSRRRRSAGHRRYEPTAVYELAARLRANGVDLDRATGPWRVRERRAARSARTSREVRAVITNETTELAVDTREHAADVAGLLNWCGVHELEPVPELEPPTSTER